MKEILRGITKRDINRRKLKLKYRDEYTIQQEEKKAERELKRINRELKIKRTTT